MGTNNAKNGIGNLFRGEAFFKGAGKAAVFGIGEVTANYQAFAIDVAMTVALMSLTGIVVANGKMG